MERKDFIPVKLPLGKHLTEQVGQAEQQSAQMIFILCSPLILQNHWRRGRTANTKDNPPQTREINYV